jgi:hypothetical protein
MRSRIMYIEDKSGGLTGPCRIGRVLFSKTGATLKYGNRTFQSLKGAGFKANYVDIDSGDRFWISGPRRDGADGLYGRVTQPEDVDADVAREYWRDVRGADCVPSQAGTASYLENPLRESRRPLADLSGLPPKALGGKRAHVARILRQRAADAG